MSDEAPKPGHNMLAGITPENLLPIDPTDLPMLLKREYPELAARGDALVANLVNWIKDHSINGVLTLDGDSEMSEGSEHFKQIQAYAKEVDEARTKVSGPLNIAFRTINAWFNRLADGVGHYGPGINAAQQARMRRVMAAQAAFRKAEIEAAQERARVLAELAAQDERNEKAALEAQQEVEDAQVAISVPAATRLHSGLGVTTSGSQRWIGTVTDIKALCAAIGRGDVPSTYIKPDDANIKRAINGKHRTAAIPGVVITEEITINRRGSV